MMKFLHYINLSFVFSSTQTIELFASIHWDKGKLKLEVCSERLPNYMRNYL